MEEWKPMQGYEDTYEVSSFGRIRSLTRKVRTGKRLVTRKSQFLTPIWLDRKGGYYVVALIRNKRRQNIRLAPIIARHFVGEPPSNVMRVEVGFKDGDRRNMHYSNLYWRYAENYDLSGAVETKYKGFYITPSGCFFKRTLLGDKVLAGHVERLGYKTYTFHTGGAQVTTSCHRLVAETFVPNTNPAFTVVDHIDRNPTNNHYTNLRWCTQEMNNQYARKVLPFVPDIKLLIQQKKPDKYIAMLYDVDVQVIKRIRQGRTYKNIPIKGNPQ